MGWGSREIPTNTLINNISLKVVNEYLLKRFKNFQTKVFVFAEGRSSGAGTEWKKDIF